MGARRIMITGGAGRLGRHVVRAVAATAGVRVLDIAPPEDDVAFHRVDIRDGEACRTALRGSDAVIHLAGLDDGDAVRPRDYLDVNVAGAWNVFAGALAAGVENIVVASSTAALGIGRATPPDYLPVDEAHALRPGDEYGLSKQLIEAQAAWIARAGHARVTCLRPTLIMRPEMEPRFPAQLALPDPDSPPPAGADQAYGALAPTRSYVPSADAARAFHLALDRWERCFRDLPDRRAGHARPDRSVVADARGLGPAPGAPPSGPLGGRSEPFPPGYGQSRTQSRLARARRRPGLNAGDCRRAPLAAPFDAATRERGDGPCARRS